MSYSYKTDITKFYVGYRENWVDKHLYMSPDVFKGTCDYPGDDTQDEQGNPVSAGEIPKYVDSSEYQIDFRRGLVTFAEEFDSSILPVYASFAHLTGIRNVTSQELSRVVSASGNYRYKALISNKYPESINAKWVNRNDNYTPTKIYVDGELKPQLTTVTPYDTLTVKGG